MLTIKHFLFAFLCVGLFQSAYAANLSSSAYVNITSDTAANAKNIAFDEARKQVIKDVLSQYADPEQLNETLKNANVDDLTNLVASSMIEGEKLSSSAYSANISMEIDRKNAKKWLTDNNIQNWLPDETEFDVFLVQVIMKDKLADWIEINKIAREDNIEMLTKYINGNQITVEIPVSNRNAFTIAVAEKGWKYYNKDGVLRIWK